MYRSRLELHEELVSILGSRHVYFQPPPTIRIEYPCIIYSWSNENVEFADNLRYQKHKRYAVTIIDKNPDSILPEKMDRFQYCSFDRMYTADNLNHFSFTLYY